jgi:hypothetical protein
MATLINLPHEVQDLISNYFRKIDPFSKAPGVASIKAVHRNFKEVPLWKNHEWKERIRKWRDENLTKLRWKYQHGTLPDEMIKMGWESKINNEYRSQNCFVETIVGTTLGTGFIPVPKEYKVIWFVVSLHDLVTGVRPLPHCFGNDGNADHQADNGTYRLTAANFVPAPTLETLIPINKRLNWLKECFRECVLEHWGEKMVEKKRGEKPDFIKEFKNMMDLPSDYELSQTYLFRMFLRELLVRSEQVHEKEGYFRRSQNIDDLCRHNINVLK